MDKLSSSNKPAPSVCRPFVDSFQKNQQDVSLEDALTYMKQLRTARSTQIATTWSELWHSLNDKCKQALRSGLFVDETQFLGGALSQKKREEVTKALRPGGECAEMGLTEGEATAVLLYTAECKTKNSSLFCYVNESLRQGSFDSMQVFVVTMVSALRKLRDHSEPVGCVCHWSDHIPVETDAHYIPCSFFSTTRSLGEKPDTINGQNDTTYKETVYIIPYKRHAAVIPKCLTFHLKEEEVIFEPGTVFRRIAGNIYEELPPADVIPVCEPELRLTPNGNTLVPAQQTQLLFPIGTRFLPLTDKRHSGDPPRPAVVAAASHK